MEGCTEQDFEEVADYFYDKICKKDLLNENTTTFNLRRTYVVNHACIWNKIDDIGKTIRIAAKNDYIAHVVFDGGTLEMTPNSFYRLEDLT